MPIILLSAPETFSTGEWITDIAPGSDREPSAVQYRTAVYAPTDNDAVPVAVCPDLDDIHPAAVAAANAALISAAPELYAAVKAFMSGGQPGLGKGPGRAAQGNHHRPAACRAACRSERGLTGHPVP